MMLLPVGGVGVLWERNEDGKESQGVSFAKSSRMRMLGYLNCSSEALGSTYIPRFCRNCNLALHTPLDNFKAD